MQPPMSFKTTRDIHLARAKTAAPHATAQAQESKPATPIKKPRDPPVTIPATIPHTTSQDQESRQSSPRTRHQESPTTGKVPQHEPQEMTRNRNPYAIWKAHQPQDPPPPSPHGHGISGGVHGPSATSSSPARLRWSPLPGAHLFPSPSRPAWKRTCPQGSYVL